MELTLHTVAVPPVLDPGTLPGFAEALSAALAAPGVVALVGSPGCFCRGMSLGDAAPGELLAGFAELLLALRGAGRPTIAVVNGDALGGGLGLAAACDLVIASREARFGLPEALFGLVPAMVLPIVAERMTPAGARRLALTGTSRSAAEAQAFGLVDRVSADLRRVLREESRRLGRAAPASVAWLRTPPAELAAAVRAGAATTAGFLARPDTRARLAAFAAGEAPWEAECPQ